MKTILIFMLYFTVAYGLIIGLWIIGHLRNRRRVQSIPDRVLLAPEDLIDVNLCGVTGNLHRWKYNGEDSRGTRYSQCQDCGEVMES